MSGKESKSDDKCPACNGTGVGKVISAPKCPSCGGTGRKQKPKSV